MLALGLVAAASPVALMYLLVNLYAAGVSVYYGGMSAEPGCAKISSSPSRTLWRGVAACPRCTRR